MSDAASLTYEDAAVLFRAANLPSSLRHVREKIWTTRDARGRLICPVEVIGYHVKRLRPENVARLVAFLSKNNRSRKVYPGVKGKAAQ